MIHKGIALVVAIAALAFVSSASAATNLKVKNLRLSPSKVWMHPVSEHKFHFRPVSEH